jgi:hypothetical protein
VGERSERIKSLNQSETEVLHYLFRDPYFKVKDIARELFRGEGGVRTNLTSIYSKLEVPEHIQNKRKWVFREYSEAYEYVFHQDEWEAKQAAQRVSQQPELFIKPPDPVFVSKSEASEGEPEPQPETVIASPNSRVRFPTAFFIIFLITFIGLVAAWYEFVYKDLTSVTLFQFDPLFYADFNGDDVPPELEIEGSPVTLDGTLQSYDYEEMRIKLGDESWQNYTVYAGIRQWGCSFEKGEERRFSHIGVRYIDNTYHLAYSWRSCVQRPYEILIKIKVNGNWITITYSDYSRWPIPLINFRSPANSSGGVFIYLDGDSALDYLLVLPGT